MGTPRYAFRNALKMCCIIELKLLAQTRRLLCVLHVSKRRVDVDADMDESMRRHDACWLGLGVEVVKRSVTPRTRIAFRHCHRLFGGRTRGASSTCAMNIHTIRLTLLSAFFKRRIAAITDALGLLKFAG